MKKITILTALMVTSLGFSQTSLPITFTDANQLMSTDGGTISSLVPDPSDAANQVMQMIGGIDTWDNAQIILSPAVDLSNDGANTITFRINPIGVSGKRDHLLKFELASNKDINGAVEFSTTNSGWQTITANFPAGLGSYDKIILFTDGGNWYNDYYNNNTGTYLVDDIVLVTNIPQITFPFTFTNANQLMSTDGGTISSLVPDPSDAANQVMQMIGGIDTWDNAQIILSSAVDLSNDATNNFTFRINPIGITGNRDHLLKFETATTKAEFFFTTTDSGWQTITANFPVGLGTYDKMVLFTDTGNWYNDYYNNNTGTYLVDDIKFAEILSTAKFDKSNIKMYPNPVKNTLTIEANSTIQKISVYNILGQEVIAMSPINNSATLQTIALQKGVYMLKTDVNGNIYTSKIIKE